MTTPDHDPVTPAIGLVKHIVKVISQRPFILIFLFLPLVTLTNQNITLDSLGQIKDDAREAGPR